MISANKTKRCSAFSAFVLLFTLLFAASAVADRDTYVSGPSIRVSMISQDPDPVKPGEYLELRWMVTNMGSTPLEDVEFMLVEDYPFELLGVDDGTRQLGTIQGNQEGEEGVVLYYRVRIEDDASEGVNKLTLMYRYKGLEDWAKLDYFEIRVQSVDAAIIVQDVRFDPARIMPGGEGRMTLVLKNLADSAMKDVNVKLDLALSTIPRSATGAESSILYEVLPFAPVGSSSEQRLSSIEAGETIDVGYSLMAYPDAKSRVYKLPIILTYKDELDNEFTKNDIVGVVVGALPDIYVVIDSSDLVSGKKSGKVSFKFVNRGVTDVKFLDVILKDTEDYEIVSSSEEYIGNIDSDDFESVEFSLYLNNNKDAKKSSTIDFPLHVDFKDANNVDYTKDITVRYRIYTAEEKGESQSQSAMLIVLAIIIIIGVWLVYRWWSRRRKMPK